MSTPVFSKEISTPVSGRKQRIREGVPLPLLVLLRLVRTSNGKSFVSFLFNRGTLTFMKRMTLIRDIFRISTHIRCEHLEEETLSFIRAVLSLPPGANGCILEAGCFKGGSTAKFSLAAALVARELVVFDSFEGIPDNSEVHGNLWGDQIKFAKGDYSGALDEVMYNVRKFGEIRVCRFVAGFFEDTMPRFNQPIAAAYLDVDLASSTRTCLMHVWPLLAPGGVLFSQDGHLQLVLDVLNDDEFWRQQLGTSKPVVHGFGKSKLIWCQKQ
jgi:O-methyltransferase